MKPTPPIAKPPRKKVLVPLVLEAGIVIATAGAALAAAGCGDDDAPPQVDASVDAPPDGPIV